MHSQAAGHPQARPAAPTSPTVRLGTIQIDREAGSVRVPGSVALREGWLEQAICRVGSREHESLVSVEMPPSAVHAAMLLAGLKPGAPGRWRVRDDGSLELVPPTGERVDVEVEWTAADGRPMRCALTEWITTPKGAPPIVFVFSGSVTREAAAVPYAADQSGSVVGLVTFGDEPIASVAVVPDRAEVAEPSLLARSERIPAEGTPVTIMIRRAAPAR
ncbi:MAG: YdjY domain-containing protein [Phycisphaerales bacterium]